MNARLTLPVLFALAALGSAPVLAGPAKVTLEIHPDNGTPADADFLETQTQILQKQEILMPVIDRLGLVEKIGKPRAEVVRMLRDSLTVKTSRNTSLIEIVVNQPDQNLAADIATTVALVYKERRMRDVKTNAEKQLAEMRDELMKLRVRADQANGQATKLRQELSIIDPDPESGRTMATTQNVEALGRAIAAQATHVEQLSARCQALSKLKREELLQALTALKIDDPVINYVLPKLAEARAGEAGLLAGGVSEKDPKVSSLRAQMDVYRRTLEQQQEGILQGQLTALKIEQETLAACEEQLERRRAKAVATQGQTQKYSEAKSEYLMAKTLADAMEQKYTALRFDSAVSIEPVKIWELPERSAK